MEVYKIGNQPSVNTGDINPGTLTIINNFLNEKIDERKSPYTIKQYKSTLYIVFSQLGKDVTEITSYDMLSWLEEFKQNKKVTTVINYFSILYNFFNYCSSEAIISKNPMKKRWKPKEIEPIPKALSNQDYIRVKMEAENLSLRDRALVEFFGSTGARLSEVSNLDIKDINLKDCVANIIGKGDKPRVVFFSKECSYMLEQLIGNRSLEEPLFLSRYNQRLSRRYIQYLISDLRNKIGLKKKLSPHVFRHTFATALLSKGAEIEYVSQMLGHSNLDTTKIYARIQPNDRKAIYFKCMG